MPTVELKSPGEAWRKLEVEHSAEHDLRTYCNKNPDGGGVGDPRIVKINGLEEVEIASEVRFSDGSHWSTRRGWIRTPEATLLETAQASGVMEKAADAFERSIREAYGRRLPFFAIVLTPNGPRWITTFSTERMVSLLREIAAFIETQNG